MTSNLGIVLLVLHTRVLQHAQRSTEREEQSEYANNKTHNMLFLALPTLLFDVRSKQPQFTN